MTAAGTVTPSSPPPLTSVIFSLEFAAALLVTLMIVWPRLLAFLRGGSAVSAASLTPEDVVAASVEHHRSPRSILRWAVAILVVLSTLLYALGVADAAAELFAVVEAAPPRFYSNPAMLMGVAQSVRLTAEHNMLPVVAALSVLYLLLQTFCIPGTIVLNVALGAVLGLPLGVTMCVLLGTVGAALCFGLSSLVGVRLVERVDGWLMQGKGVTRLKKQVDRFRGDLWAYLLFLRLTPILPNWLINLASPVVGVPLPTFLTATLAGITPQTYLAVRFGTMAKAAAGDSIVQLHDTILIALIGLAVVAASRLKHRFGAASQPTAAAESAAFP